MIPRRGRRGREAGGKLIDDFLNDSPPAGRPAGPGGCRGAGSPPALNDFLNDFPPAGEAGGKTINDFINDFPSAGEAGGT